MRRGCGAALSAARFAPGRLTRILQPTLAAILTALLAHSPRSRAAIPPAEKLLPEDTLLVVTIPDFTKLRGICAQLPQSRLWRDPAMKPFHDQFLMKWTEEFVAPLERDLGVKFTNYISLLQGQLTVAVTPEGWQGTGDPNPAVLLLVDVKGKSSELKTNLADLRRKWTDAGKPIRSEPIRGVEFFTVTLSSNDVPKSVKQFFPQHQEIREVGKKTERKTSRNDELVVGQFDSLLIVSTSMNAVEKVVLHLAGGDAAPTLADQAGFDANRLALFRDAPLFGWFNAKAFFDVLARAPPEVPNPEAPSPLPPLQPDKALRALGFAGLRTIAFDLRNSGEGVVLELFLGAPDGTRQGLFKMLAVGARDSAPPAFVPADVVRFRRCRLNGQEAWLTVKKVLNDLPPQALNTWNFLVESAELAAKDKDPDYNLERDFVGNLGDDWISYEKAPRGNTPEELDSPPALFLIGSPNAGQLLDGLKGPLSIWSPRAQNPDVREFLGRRIYTIPIVGGLPFIGVAKPMPRKLSYAAGNGYVALSTEVTMVEEFLRSSEGQARSLREIVGFDEAIQKVGGPAGGLLGYENQRERMRTLVDALKHPAEVPTNTPGPLNPLANSLPFARPEKSLGDWMDYSLLPDFDRVSKYFSFTVYGGEVSVDGITFRYFHPTPPQLRK